MLQQLITNHIDLWTSAETQRKTTGRGSNSKIELTGIKKLRELILELAVRGLLVPQDPNDEPASVLLEKIAAEKSRLIKDGKIKKQKSLPTISADEKPFDLPDGWEWERLGNLGYTQTGGTPSKSHPDFFGSDFPFIKPGDIYLEKVDYQNEGLSLEGAQSLGRIAPSGSILMVCIGTIGKCNSIAMDCTFNQQINSITPLANITDFTLSALRSNFFQNEAWARSSSTTIAILNKGKWDTILVPLPPLSEQHRIVAKVDELMALCDQLEQQQLEHSDTHHTLVTTLLDSLCQAADNDQFQTIWSQLAANFDTLFTTEASIDQLKQTLLQLAVMGKLVPQDPNDEPASVLLEKIAAEKESLIKSGKVKKQKPLSEITENEMSFPLADKWKWVRLNDLFNIIVDCPHSTPKFLESGYLSLDTNSFKDGKLIKAKFRYVSKETFNDRNSRLQPKAGDIVFAREGSVGESVVIPEGIECCLGQRVMLFRGSNWLSPDFLRLTISSQGAIAKLLSLHKGIGAKHVNVRDMKNYVIAVPPTTEQHRIVAKADELMALCDQLKDRLNQAQTTQQQLAHAIVEQAVM